MHPMHHHAASATQVASACVAKVVDHATAAAGDGATALQMVCPALPYGFRTHMMHHAMAYAVLDG
jgi:hypothetical protein